MTVPEPGARHSAAAGSTLQGSLRAGACALAPGAAERLDHSPASPTLQGALQKERRGTLPYAPSWTASHVPPEGSVGSIKRGVPGERGRVGRHCPGGVPDLTSPSSFFSVISPVGDL